jgi:hypothetical protein
MPSAVREVNTLKSHWMQWDFKGRYAASFIW